jgi:transcriptional regulator with XRE-family HTH domain
LLHSNRAIPGLWEPGKDCSKQTSLGSRLAEERKRLGLKQAAFAALVGTDMPKQSLYENDRRELRADYLARLAEADFDILYILTGRRREGAWLEAGPSELLSAYLSLPADLQAALEGFARALRDQFFRPHAGVVHPQSPYVAESGGPMPRRPRGKK